MIRGMIWMVTVAALACGGVMVAGRAGAEPAQAARPQVLPVTTVAERPVCPGPETLQAPEGAATIPRPGPVAVAGVAVPPVGAAEPAAAPGTTPATTAGPGLTLGALRAGGTSRDTRAVTGTAAAGRAAYAHLIADAPGPLQAVATSGGQVPAVGAAQWTLARTGDLRGLATAACGAAGTDTWLVGGGTEAGRRARLLLANPSTAPAVVDVTVYGPRGLVQTPAGTGVVVTPGGEKALYVDALAPGLAAIAVRVQARTGRIVALLQDSLLRGTTPGGVDDVQPAAGPATLQVIPGVAVRTPAPGPGQSTGTLPSDPQAAGATAVRVVVPGTGEAVVRVHLLGPDGELDLPGGGVATVEGRSVADVAVTGVPDGVYAAIVESDTPVVAGALVGRVSTSAAAADGEQPDPAELAWAAAARPLSSPTALALPVLPGWAAGYAGRPAVTARLSLAATGREASVQVREVAADGGVGAPQTVAVPAEHAVSVDVGAGAVGVVLQAGTTASTGTVAPTGAVVAALVLTAPDAAGDMVSVEPVRPGEVAGRPAPVVLPDPGLGLPVAADPGAAGSG